MPALLGAGSAGFRCWGREAAVPRRRVPCGQWGAPLTHPGPAEEATGELQRQSRGREPEPRRVHRYPSSLRVCTFLASTQRHMPTLYAASICGRWDLWGPTTNIPTLLHFLFKYWSPKGLNKYSEPCFPKPMEAFLSHLSCSPHILAFCLSRIHSTSVCIQVMPFTLSSPWAGRYVM